MIAGRAATVSKFLILVLVLATLAGCQTPSKIAVKATPNPIHPDRFEYTVEFVPQFSFTR